MKNNKKYLLSLLGILLCLTVFWGCSTEQAPVQTEVPTTVEATEPEAEPQYELYWNLDRGMYAGAGEDGGTSRQPEADGCYYARFTHEGETVVLKVKTRKLMNKIDIGDDLIGLDVDEDGVIQGFKYLTQLPLKTTVYNCYVQSFEGQVVVTNVNSGLDGEEIEVQRNDGTRVYDMTGTTGPIGCNTEMVFMDCIMGISDLQDNLTHVYITNRALYMNQHPGYCEHCKTDVTWYEWTRQDRLPMVAGHYQLMHNVRNEAQNNIAANSQVCLDLNGKTIMSDNYNAKRIYSLHSEGARLAIMDSSPDGSGRIAAKGEISAHGGMIWVRYGQLDLYSGTIDGSELVDQGNGTVINSGGDTVVHIHGGTIIGGTAACIYDEANNSYGAATGGAMYINGKLIMDGGIIRDGYAQAALVYENGQQSAKRGIAGNVFLATGSEAEINGGTITGGRAGGIAGNLYVNGKMTMNGGSITGGYITYGGSMGGNLYVGGEAVVTLNNVTIRDGVARNHAGNVYNYGMLIVNGGSITNPTIYSVKDGTKMENTASRNIFMVNGQMHVNGGFIEGGISMVDTIEHDGKSPYVALSGNARIFNDLGWSNLTVSGADVKVYNLGKQASIGISGTGIFSEPTQEENLPYFFSDKGGDICYFDKCLAVGRVQCLCGGNEIHESWCDGKKDLWKSWTETTKLPNQDGKYYLVNDIALEAVQGVAKDNHVQLDLNGKTVTCVLAGRIYNVIQENTALTITDTVGGGIFNRIDTEPYAAQGGLIWGGADSTITLYRGTYDGGNAIDQSSGACVKTGGVLNLYDATIQNGVATRSGSVAIDKTGVFNMYGGKIIGGTALEGAAGGNLAVEGVANLFGGVIEGGNAVNGPGGNVAVSGMLDLQGTQILGGTANVGGNVYLSGTMHMGGGSIQQGTARNFAGNIQINGNMTMTGGMISQGTAVAVKSANVTIREGKCLEISGGTIEGYIDGWVVVQEDGSTLRAKLLLSGNPVIYAHNGTGILADTGYDVQISGALTDGAKLQLSLLGGAPEGAIVTATEGYSITETDRLAFVNTDPQLELILQENALFYQTVGVEYYCICGGKAVGVGDHVCQDAKWVPWNKTDSLPVTPGNYYLTGDVDCTTTHVVGDGSQNAEVSIDLRGFTVTNSNEGRGHTVHKYGTLNITDTVGGGQIVKDPNVTYNGWGSGIFLNGGDLNLYAGTLEGSHVASAKHTGLVLVGKEATFRMYGGSVQNGKAVGAGNIQIEGTMYLYAGTVTGGTSIEGNTRKEAGNIWIKPDAKLYMSGGLITNGIGHNNWGGNVLLQGEMTMTGGEIYGGNENDKREGANLVLHGDAILNMSGGHIHGSMRQFNSANTVLNLSGSAKIYNPEGGSQLIWFWDASKQLKINIVGALNADAKILVNGNLGDKLPVADPKPEYAKHFGTNDLAAVYQSDGLYLYAEGTLLQCACGGKAAGMQNHTCQDVVWLPWNDPNKLPSTAGNYYLTVPVSTAVVYLYQPNQQYRLDLHGQTVTVKAGERGFRLTDTAAGMELSITDSVGGGSICLASQSQFNSHGSIIWLQNASGNPMVLNLYAGIIDGGNIPNTGNGLINLPANSVFNMYGGTVKNGSCANGGNVNTAGTVNMYGGSIENGTATTGGGNIAISATGHWYLHGGTVSGGTGLPNWGGNVLLQGTMTMSGGHITGGKSNGSAAFRGNVCLNGTGTLNMSGGTVDGQVCSFNSNDTKVNLSGKAVIWSPTGQNHLSVIEGGKTITVTVTGALDPEAKIGITGVTAGGLVAGAAQNYTITEQDLACFAPECELKNSKIYMK